MSDSKDAKASQAIAACVRTLRHLSDDGNVPPKWRDLFRDKASDKRGRKSTEVRDLEIATRMRRERQRAGNKGITKFAAQLADEYHSRDLAPALNTSKIFDIEREYLLAVLLFEVLAQDDLNKDE